MKYSLKILIFLLLMVGCADKNAFSKFNMTKYQELSASSVQNSKLKSKESVNGFFSVIYLNEIYPKKYNGDEYFFISLYLKDKNYDDLNIILNKRTPIKIEQLPFDNDFSTLISGKNRWKKDYFLVFKKEDSNTLSFTVENGQFSSVALMYQKGKQ